MSQENFHKELSRITLYNLSFNYCYRYDINLARIMYATNSLHRKAKTGRTLGTWHQYLVNVPGLRYSRQIEFREELIHFLTT